jgi:hypothetical protein
MVFRASARSATILLQQLSYQQIRATVISAWSSGERYCAPDRCRSRALLTMAVPVTAERSIPLESAVARPRDSGGSLVAGFRRFLGHPWV